MKCPSCGGLIEESDAPFCPFCGMQIRTSSAGKPAQRINTAIDAPTSIPSSNPPSATGMASYAPGVYGTSTPPISTAATISLVFGILGWFTAPVIFSIIAIVAGYRARREIEESSGRLGGSGRATAGIIMGVIQLALFVFACLVFAVIFFLAV